MSDPLDGATKQVADAYWGTSPAPVKRDAHGLGPAPRALTIGMAEYVKRAGATLFSLWVTLAVLFGFADAVTIAVMKGLVAPPFSVLFVVLAVLSYRKRAALRRRLVRVCEEGAIVGAEVKNIHQLQQRRHVRTTITYRVEGAPRLVQLVSSDQVVAFLQVGLRDEVLWLAAEPDLVVPTFMVA